MAISGVCKECGNGTLNNDLVPAFEFSASDFDEDNGNVVYTASCLRCGSEHVDLVA